MIPTRDSSPPVTVTVTAGDVDAGPGSLTIMICRRPCRTGRVTGSGGAQRPGTAAARGQPSSAGGPRPGPAASVAARRLPAGRNHDRQNLNDIGGSYAFLRRISADSPA